MCGETQKRKPTENQHNDSADEDGRDSAHSGSHPWFLRQADGYTETLATQFWRRYRTIVQIFEEIWENRHKPFQLSLIKKLMKAMAESGVSGPPNLKSAVLGVSVLQFPLHTYMIFSLRNSNEHRLLGDSENTWGFGQIVALVLLGSTLVQSMGTITSTTSFLCASKCLN